MARTHSSAARSEECGFYNGRPLFLRDWWAELKTSQRWAISAFLLFYTLGLFLFCSSITTDIYFEHTLQLVGLRRTGVPDQAVTYNLTTRNGVGFWSNVDYQLGQVQYSPIEKVNGLLQLHARIGMELWVLCATRAHRAKACANTAFVLLTLGLCGLFTGYFLMIFNRKVMITVVISSTVLLQASFALIYAASIEYNSCVIDRQIQQTDEQINYVSYKGRYFVPTFTLNNQPVVGVLISYVFAFLPMSVIGLTLLIKNTENL